MRVIPEINYFFSRINGDNRICPVHVSFHMAIVQRWEGNKWQCPLIVYSRDLMRLAKISGLFANCLQVIF